MFEQCFGCIVLQYYMFQEWVCGIGYVEIWVQLVVYVFQGQEGFDYQCQIGWQGQVVVVQQLGNVIQYQVDVQVFQWYVVILVDELVDVVLQVVFVYFYVVGLVQQYIGYVLWVLFDQFVQQLCDLEVVYFG